MLITSPFSYKIKILIKNMKYTLGTDIIELKRIEHAIERWGERFLRRVYTEKEIERYRGRLPSLAARFAAKEAVIKALQPRDGYIFWRDMEVLTEPGGKPYLNLYGRARSRAEALGIKEIEISLSHSREYALALVLGVRE
jgi:holo-[acyl-carrier protein] synthase